MERDKALQIVNNQISGPRYDHTVRVLHTAIDLARRFGADVKNRISGYFSRLCKAPFHT